MFNKDGVYHQIKALIGHLEEKLEKVEKDEMSNQDLTEMAVKVEMMWTVLCRREKRRGPYARRQSEAA